jgi:endo-1,4-beta-xylanase
MLNVKRIGLLLLIALLVFGCKPEPEENVKNTELTLTVGERKNIADDILPEGATNITWTSNAPAVVSVTNGILEALSITNGGSNRFTSGTATGTAIITVTASGGFKETVSVTTTTAASGDIMSLPPLKEQFASHFFMGNIFNPGDVSSTAVTNQRLTRHFNVLTAENNMKPSYISPSQGNYSWTTADQMVKAAIASGFKVVGHTLLWHSQNASWMTSMANQSKETALTAMKSYITSVVDHFKGRIYSWDVLNEVFPDSGSDTNWKTAMRNENPWFKAIGFDFVFEGYKAARLADSTAILYYNDYNLDNVGKATMVRNMVRDVNLQWQSDSEYDNRKLIEGIGMQSHHNTGVSANSIRSSLNLFRALGVKISISELDVLGQGYNDFSGSTGQGTNKHTSSTVTNTGLITQARLYNEYMKLYIQNSDIIERVSLWGVTDNSSWRSGGLPLLFDPNGRAKPAYYRFIGALN